MPLHHVLAPSEGGEHQNFQKEEPGLSNPKEEPKGVLGEQR